MGVIDHDHYKATVSFYEYFKTKMTPEQKSLFLGYMKFAVSPLPERINILFRHRFKIGKANGILLFKTILRKPIGSKL
jgi:hypothetical protein